jgi:hypothetical protein
MKPCLFDYFGQFGCCWIQIRIRIPNMDPDPDPRDGQMNEDSDPQQLKMVIYHGWCRKREEKEKEVERLLRIRINLQMISQAAKLYLWNMSLFEHFFKGLSLYLEARIWIRIRIRIRIRICIK